MCLRVVQFRSVPLGHASDGDPRRRSLQLSDSLYVAVSKRDKPADTSLYRAVDDLDFCVTLSETSPAGVKLARPVPSNLSVQDPNQ